MPDNTRFKLHFTGTGAGAAKVHRNFSSILISNAAHSLLLDCGDGILRNLLSQSIQTGTVDAILISHLHADHYTGIPALLTGMKADGRSKPLRIFIPEAELQFIRTFLSRSYISPARLGFALELKAYSREFNIEVAPGFVLTPFSNSHLDKYRGREFDSPPGFQSFSFLLHGGPRNVFISGDLGGIADLENIPADSGQMVIMETSHVNPEEAFPFLLSRGFSRLVFTHIPPEMEDVLPGIVERQKIDSGKDIIIARDGLILYC